MELDNIYIEQMCIDCFKSTGGEDICMTCGFSQNGSLQYAEFPILPAHTVLNKYIIGRVIDVADEYVLYKAYDINLDRIVVIKELFPFKKGMVCRAEDGKTVIAADEVAFEEMKNTFIYKLQAIRNASIENILAFYDEFEENATAYQVIEFVEGISLEEYFEQVDKLSYEESLDIMLPIMEAVDSLHKAGIIYGCITPSNIYISVGGDIKLGDFDNVTIKNVPNVVNTTKIFDGYAAAELYKDGKISELSDVYSIGAIWYKILTGITPVSAIERVKKDKILSFSKVGAQVPSFIEAVIMKALSVKEKDRFSKMEQFILSLQGEGWQPTRKRTKTILISVAVSLIFVAIGLFSIFTISSNSIVPTKDAQITLWYVDEGDSQLNKRWKTISDEFNSYVNSQRKIGKTEITLKCVGVSKEEYKSSLDNALKNGEGPDIYCSSFYSKDEQAYSLSDLYSKIESSEDSFSNVYIEMKEVFASDNKIAFCYDLPVLYVSTRGSSSMPKRTDSLKLLKNYTEDESRYYSDPLVCNPKSILYTSYAYGYKDGEDNKVLKDVYDEARIYKYGSSWKGSNIVYSSTKFYLGLVSEYNEFYSNAFGKFSMLSIKGDNATPNYIFPETWSVNKNSSDENIKAAIFLFYYLLNTTEGQNAICCNTGNTYYIPLKQKLVDEITALDKQYDAVINASYSLSAKNADRYTFEYKKAYDLEKLAKESSSTQKNFNSVAAKTK